MVSNCQEVKRAASQLPYESCFREIPIPQVTAAYSKILNPKPGRQKLQTLFSAVRPTGLIKSSAGSGQWSDLG